jgi:hypothetical protein
MVEFRDNYHRLFRSLLVCTCATGHEAVGHDWFYWKSDFLGIVHPVVIQAGLAEGLEMLFAAVIDLLEK